MIALKVPKEEAEKAKEELIKRDLIDISHKVISDDAYIYFPVSSDPKLQWDVVEKKLPKRDKTPTFREALEEKLPREKLRNLKTSQDIIGDIAIIELPIELEENGKLIGQTLREIKPYITTVFRKGKHEGKYRTQKLILLSGKNKKETIHKENNVELKLNVEKVYFSPRLSTERERITELVEKNERVLVMGSGCGPFSCVIAKNSEAAEVTGVEVNPNAHKYALENIKLNKLDNVIAIKGDVTKIELEGEFDRIIMPAPHNAEEFLDVALAKIREDGIIHYYDFSGEDTSEIQNMLREFAAKTNKKIRVLRSVKCGQIAPDEYRVCIDFKVS